MSSDEELTKIVVDLPNHWATGGEGMWAKPLGRDLYEIRSIPFHAYGFNFGDVVRARKPAPDKKPLVSELVRPSGHRTLRVFFSESVAEPTRLELLQSLSGLKASFEGATTRHYAIDIEPDGDYAAVCARLAEWEAQGLLEYETCEQRAAGRFDDGPEVPDK